MCRPFVGVATCADRMVAVMGSVHLIEAAQTGTADVPPLSAVAEYAYAAVTTPGARLVHVAGACPLDPSGVVTPVGDIPGQTRACMANLAQALAAAGSGLTDVVKTTVYVASADQDDLVAAWLAWLNRWASLEISPV